MEDQVLSALAELGYLAEAKASNKKYNQIGGLHDHTTGLDSRRNRCLKRGRAV
jgi:hypothetical protein